MIRIHNVNSDNWPGLDFEYTDMYCTIHPYTIVYLHPEKSGDCMKIDGSIEDVCCLIA